MSACRCVSLWRAHFCTRSVRPYASMDCRSMRTRIATVARSFVGSMVDGSLLGYLTSRNASRNNLDRFGFVACPKARSVVSRGVTRTYVRTWRRGRMSAPPSAHLSDGPGEG